MVKCFVEKEKQKAVSPHDSSIQNSQKNSILSRQTLSRTAHVTRGATHLPVPPPSLILALAKVDFESRDLPEHILKASHPILVK